MSFTLQCFEVQYSTCKIQWLKNKEREHRIVKKTFNGFKNPIEYINFDAGFCLASSVTLSCRCYCTVIRPPM